MVLFIINHFIYHKKKRKDSRIKKISIIFCVQNISYDTKINFRSHIYIEKNCDLGNQNILIINQSRVVLKMQMEITVTIYLLTHICVLIFKIASDEKCMIK